jgi:acetyl-CoA acyltransferase
MDRSAYIVAYRRSPFTFARKGLLAGVRPDDLSARVIAALVESTGVPGEEIEDVIWGCAYPEGEQGINLGRVVAGLAGLPDGVCGTTVNRWCGSAIQAVQMGAGAIAMNAGEAFICGGVESMSRVPMYGFNLLPPTAWSKEQASDYLNVGLSAERVARKYGISREEQDRFAFDSQAKALAAQREGRLAQEIVPMPVGDALVANDGCVRESSMAKLAELKPIFMEGGTVTAATTSPMTDGSTALLVCSEGFLKRHKLEPVARVRSFAVAGCEAGVMGLGPIHASRKALDRAGLKMKDIEVVEMNEAFAAQAEACRRDLDIPEERLNRDGGGIALGHPLGATGGRLVGSAVRLMRQVKGRHALATQCIGGGMGIAMVLDAA